MSPWPIVNRHLHHPDINSNCQPPACGQLLRCDKHIHSRLWLLAKLSSCARPWSSMFTVPLLHGSKCSFTSKVEGPTRHVGLKACESGGEGCRLGVIGCWVALKFSPYVLAATSRLQGTSEVSHCDRWQKQEKNMGSFGMHSYKYSFWWWWRYWVFLFCFFKQSVMNSAIFLAFKNQQLLLWIIPSVMSLATWLQMLHSLHVFACCRITAQRAFWVYS